jgi:hypothetical protein
VSEKLKANIGKQWNDTVFVIVILVKGFVVGTVAYFVSLGLTLIMKQFGSDGESASALKFFDECTAAGTYLVVVAKDLVGYAFK